MISEFIKDLGSFVILMLIICLVCYMAVEAADKEAEAKQNKITQWVEEMGR